MPLSSATLVYYDNVSAIYLTTNPVQHQRTKHIEIDMHFVHDMVARGHVRVLHVLSRYQYSDIFTKGLPFALFKEFHSSLSVRSSLAPIAGECLSLIGIDEIASILSLSVVPENLNADGYVAQLEPKMAPKFGL
ncbi:ribonuclease H-like domain-containing protein [Tanacetum coccineum]